MYKENNMEDGTEALFVNIKHFLLLLSIFWQLFCTFFPTVDMLGQILTLILILWQLVITI